MTLAELTDQLRQVLRDPTVEASLTTWINQSMLELAGQFELPALRLRTAASLSTTTSDWVYDLSEASHSLGYEYHKRVVRIASSTQTSGFPIESDFTAFDDVDFEHDDTGTAVQRVAVEGDQLGIYPLAADTLSLWFYRKPFEVEDDDDEPEIPEASFQYQVLVPKVVLKAFRIYPDLATDVRGDNTKALALWEGRLHTGLYGDGFTQGWVPTLQKQRGPRVRGPARGSQLSGGMGRGWWM